MNNPRVSVIMPVYNAERYLAEAVESVLSQTFRDFEFVIIDDGSKDRSREILEKYAAEDPRVRLTSRPNTGYTVALNEALSYARGEYLARMDSDDVSLPQRLEKQVAFLDAHPDHVAVGCRVMLMDADGDPIALAHPQQTHEEIDYQHLYRGAGTIMTHPSVTMRTEAVRKVGGYRKECEPAEDLDLFLRLAEVGRLAKLPDVLFHYRMHVNSVCHTRSLEQRKVVRKISAEARQRRGLVVDDPRIPPINLTLPTEPDIRLAWAREAFHGGNFRTARKHAAWLVRHRPAGAAGWKLLLGSLAGPGAKRVYDRVFGGRRGTAGAAAPVPQNA